MHPAGAIGFEWDDSNEEHLARHRIEPWEVEEVFDNQPVWLPNKASGSGDWLMVGHTNGNRPLSIVVQVIEETEELRAFTGWASTPRERDIYRRQRGRR